MPGEVGVVHRLYALMVFGVLDLVAQLLPLRVELGHHPDVVEHQRGLVELRSDTEDTRAETALQRPDVPCDRRGQQALAVLPRDHQEHFPVLPLVRLAVVDPEDARHQRLLPELQRERTRSQRALRMERVRLYPLDRLARFLLVEVGVFLLQAFYDALI